ncbi:MAG TPA: hypothetical protein PLG09_11465, partial [Syntrophomonadaceae bacterium]|nr:hypothetical protein [Syntrophomonadaceae bacterium]
TAIHNRRAVFVFSGPYISSSASATDDAVIPKCDKKQLKLYRLVSILVVDKSFSNRNFKGGSNYLM